MQHYQSLCWHGVLAVPLTLVFFVICLLCVQVYCPLHPECFINTFTSSTFYFSPPPWTQTTYHPTSLLSDPPAPTYPFNKKEKSLAENTARGKKSKGKVLLYCSVLKPHSSFSYFFLLVSFFSFFFSFFFFLFFFPFFSFASYLEMEWSRFLGFRKTRQRLLAAFHETAQTVSDKTTTRVYVDVLVSFCRSILSARKH